MPIGDGRYLAERNWRGCDICGIRGSLTLWCGVLVCPKCLAPTEAKNDTKEGGR